jgi:uncharacterized protein (DUF362 family)
MSRRVFLGPISQDGGGYLERVRSGLDYIEFGKRLPSSPRVFIKPNLTFPTYRPGVMTSPDALEAAIVALQDYTADIWVGDSDSGGYNPFPMDEVYAATGIRDFAQRHGVKVVNLSKLPRAAFTFRAGGKERTIELPRLLTDEIDTLVTMPVPKVHTNTGVSLTFKNQWGCIPEPNDRLRLHPFFQETVVAVNRAVKAGSAIIDGRYGLNRSGPLQGDEVYLGWLAVASDIGSGARIGCELMRVRLDRIRHLRYAKKQGLIPSLAGVELNTPVERFLGPRFAVQRRWTDYPGYAAFRSPWLAQIGYFSRWAQPLHRLLYRFREPFYDYTRR